MNRFLKLIPGICGLLPIACAGGELRQIDSPYYAIWTDLPDDAAREAALRMTKMAEEYARRTRDFSGTISRGMPFYLYANDADYLAHGGTADSAGYFDGKFLVARASHLDDRTWHTVQHEGFHQYARGTIRGALPTWANEGLAEYFGEAVFTGDGFVAGVIPQWRLARIRQTFRQPDGFLPLRRIMELSLEEWNEKLSTVNYDQGWSMVQFLAHGEGGKYQRAFAAYIGELNNTQHPTIAWNDCFGSADGFEPQWKNYWTHLPDSSSLELYVQAQVQTYTSFIARAGVMRQTFATFEQFLASARQNKVAMNSGDWLPPSLLTQAVTRQKEFDELGCVFTLTAVKGERFARLSCKLPSGQTIAARPVMRGDRVASVSTLSLPAQTKK